MANLFAKYGTDRCLETEGASLDIDGATFILRRAGGANRRYRYALAEAARPYAKDFADVQELSDQQIALEDEVTRHAYARAVIVDWFDVDGPDGAPLPFTRENFLRLVDACPDVWDRIRDFASQPDNFRGDTTAEEDAAAVGKP